MPASEPLPTLEELTNAYQGALVSERLEGDTHEGAVHDHWAGVGAVTFRLIAEREQAEFSALYSSARGSRLDEYIESHWPGKARIGETRGVGQLRLVRPSTVGGAGTIWPGTRITVGGSGAPLAYYRVTSGGVCSATDTAKTLAVEAVTAGPGSRISVVAGDRPILRIEDPLWDNTWTVQELTCADGTLRENDDACWARITAEIFEERFGFESRIIKAMNEAGAAIVAPFRSDYLGEAADRGLNRIYVADANFVTLPALLKACRLAIPSCAMAGAGNQVLPLTTVMLDVGLTMRFWSEPENFDMDSTEDVARSAVVEYFATRENPFVWDAAACRGAVQARVPNTQSIDLTFSSAPPTLATLFSANPLPRYLTTPNRVSVSLLGPA